MMSNRYVPVIIKNKDDKSPRNLITLPSTLLNQISGYSRAKLKAGDLEFDVECHFNDTKNIVEISPEIIEDLGLFPGNITNLFIRNNKIFLGPLIGLFISNGQLKKAIAQNPNFRFIETANANKDANAILYYFTIKDVDFTKRRITGTYFNYETGNWEKKSFPYPDILYDRGGGTLESQQTVSNYIREEINKSRGLKRLNTRWSFDKWDVHKSLAKYGKMKMYLPLTILFTKEDDLIQMLQRYTSIYVKDPVKNNGKGVAKVVKVSESEYEISHFNNVTCRYTLNSSDDLLKKIVEIFEGEKFIIQRAIDLLQVNNRNADMRATVQRNGKGELTITALPVRLGQEGCPITTTRSGASVYIFEEFFAKYYSYPRERIANLRERISNFLIKCFMVMEDIYGPFGEIGIDYAIDKNLRIWFIECNAKPGKDTLYLSYDDDTIRRAFLNPLEYSKYLWSKS